jgi:hypothetical protein
MIVESPVIPVWTIYFHLVEKTGLKIFFVGPHTLTSELRQTRVGLSNQLLRVLESQQRVGSCDIVIDEESWFLQHYDHRQILCISADDISTRVAQTATAQKIILTVFLSIDGAILINWLTPKEKFHSGGFCEKHSSRLPRSCTEGALHGPQGR